MDYQLVNGIICCIAFVGWNSTWSSCDLLQKLNGIHQHLSRKYKIYIVASPNKRSELFFSLFEWQVDIKCNVCLSESLHLAGHGSHCYHLHFLYHQSESHHQRQADQTSDSIPTIVSCQDLYLHHILHNPCLCHEPLLICKYCSHHRTVNSFMLSWWIAGVLTRSYLRSDIFACMQTLVCSLTLFSSFQRHKWQMCRVCSQNAIN